MLIRQSLKDNKIKESYEVLIIGAGPAGLAAALSARDKGREVLIIEREGRPGGILKQCIHDGFGLITFKEKLTGPEYAERFIKEVKNKDIPILNSTFVMKIEKIDQCFKLHLVNSSLGAFELEAKSLILSTGCRERTSRQVFIAGTRPAGIYTAGTAQYFVNIQGYLPCKKCVILGSGDIGLIMARRLTLEGSEVLGVYEAKSTPSGLSRNIVQCLEDYKIPLHLSHTIARVYGEDRVSAVEICRVDEKMQPIEGTSEIVECDGVILSVGLIPENELAEDLGIIIDDSTKGPVVNEKFMTSVNGVFSCGNALHVNDLVDYVTESGRLAGEAAAEYIHDEPQSFNVEYCKDEFLYIVPQKISKRLPLGKTTLYFRSRKEYENVTIVLVYKDEVIFSRKYEKLKPPEMERIAVDLSSIIQNGILEDNLKLVLIQRRG